MMKDKSIAYERMLLRSVQQMMLYTIKSVLPLIVEHLNFYNFYVKTIMLKTKISLDNNPM